MPTPIILDDEAIRAVEEEEAQREALGLASTLGAVPSADEIEAERAQLTAPREPMADTGAPFQRDTVMEERLNAITRGAPQPPEMRVDPQIIQRAAQAMRARRPAPRETPPAAPPRVEGPGGLSAPAPSIQTQPQRPGPSEEDLYKRALDAVRRNKIKAGVIGAIGAFLGAKPADIQAIMAGTDAPLEAYRGLRQIRGQEAQRAAQQAQQTRAETRDQRRMDLEERRLASQDERARLQREFQMAQDQRRGRLDDSTIAMREAQLQNVQGDVAAEQAMRDPASPASRVAQQRVRAINERLRLGMSDEDVGQLSAQQADQIVRETMRDTRGRGRGGRGTGTTNPSGGVPRAQWGSDDDPLVRAAIEALPDMDEAVIRQMAATPSRSSRTGRPALQQALVAQGRTQGMTRWQQERQARIPGWDRTEGAPQLNPTAFNEARRVAIADAEFRRVVDLLEQDLAGLRPDERVSQRAGLGSERAQRIQHSLEVVRTQLRQINQEGLSVEAQRHMAEMIPNLDANVPAGALLRNVRAARDVKHQYVRAYLEQHGYSPAGGHGQARAPGGRVLVNVGGRQFLATPEQMAAMRRDGVEFSE